MHTPSTVHTSIGFSYTRVSSTLSAQWSVHWLGTHTGGRDNTGQRISPNLSHTAAAQLAQFPAERMWSRTVCSGPHHVKWPLVGQWPAPWVKAALYSPATLSCNTTAACCRIIYITFHCSTQLLLQKGEGIPHYRHIAFHSSTPLLLQRARTFRPTDISI